MAAQGLAVFFPLEEGAADDWPPRPLPDVPADVHHVLKVLTTQVGGVAVLREGTGVEASADLLLALLGRTPSPAGLRLVRTGGFTLVARVE